MTESGDYPFIFGGSKAAQVLATLLKPHPKEFRGFQRIIEQFNKGLKAIRSADASHGTKILLLNSLTGEIRNRVDDLELYLLNDDEAAESHALCLITTNYRKYEKLFNGQNKESE